jgi:hypothetical protein
MRISSFDVVRRNANAAAVADPATIVASHRRQPGSSPNPPSRAAMKRIAEVTIAAHAVTLI